MTERNCEALLLDYAAGSLDPALEMIIAAHLTLSPAARRYVAACEAVGGSMMSEDCNPASLSAGCLESMLAKIDCLEAACAEIEDCPDCCVECCEPIPQPIARLFPAEERHTLKWKHALGGMHWVSRRIDGASGNIRMIRADPGFVMPHHMHRGMEITLVLDGAIEDDTGRYVRGDLFIMEAGSHHEQIADRDAGCLCFSVNTLPIRFTGFFTRFLNPYL